MEAPAEHSWRVDLISWPGGWRCLYTHLLWPFAAGEVARRGGRSYALDCCGGGVIGCALCLYCIPWSLTRAQLRAARGIEGSIVEDAALSFCCPPCYLVQALAELDAADEEAARAAAVAGAGVGGGGVPPQMTMG